MSSMPDSDGRTIDASDARTAKEYAKMRLEGADRYLTPMGLAEEYNCSPDHMRTVLSKLAKEGEAAREGMGKYVDAVPTESTEESSGEDLTSADPGPAEHGDSDGSGAGSSALEAEYEEQQERVDALEEPEASGSVDGDRDDGDDGDQEVSESEPERVEEIHESRGLGIPQDFGYAALGIGVAALAVAVLRERSDSSESSDSSNSSEESEQQSDVSSAGGLIEG